MTINWTDLAAPFSNIDLEWRIQRSGDKNGKVWAICIPYVTNRAIMERLDKILTPAGWKNEFTTGPHGGVLCGISILVEGAWVTKWDGAENTNIEAVKGGLSGAMKRAAVQWGMGRHLYDIPESFADITESGTYRGKIKNGRDFRWNPPKLPGDNPTPIDNTPFLTLDAFIEKVESAKVGKHLANIWTKYWPEIKGWSDEGRQTAIDAKDKRKAELDPEVIG